MDENSIKISACILSKDDGQFIEDCIIHIAPYVDEIVVLDSNKDDTSIDIINSIPDLNIQQKLIIKHKPDTSQNIAELRNEVQSIASGDYVLHIDCDERFDEDFLSKMKDILKIYLKNKVIPILFRFPRLNQPDNINYPDYQIRLLYKKYSSWYGKVHEVPEIINLPRCPLAEIQMRTQNLVTIDKPMIHLYKNKINIYKRWNDLRSEDPISRYKRLLVVSIFRNSMNWINDTWTCIQNMYQYNRTVDEDSKLIIYFSFLDGDSKDGTFDMLQEYCREGSILNIQLRRFDPQMPNEPDPYIRFKKLATVRNHLIEQTIPHLQLRDDDYILFVDSDIMFSENLVYELIKDMKISGADIIAPMVYIDDYRGHGNSFFYDTLAFRSKEGNRFTHSFPYMNGMDMTKPNEIGSAGSFYLMRYNVAKIVKYTGDSDSEQVEFCNNARSKGFKIFISPRLSVYHVNFDKYNMMWH